MLIILRNKKEISHLLEPRCVPFPFFAKNITQGFGVYLSITIYEQMCLLKDPIFILKPAPHHRALLFSLNTPSNLGVLFFGDIWPRWPRWAALKFAAASSASLCGHCRRRNAERPGAPKSPFVVILLFLNQFVGIKTPIYFAGLYYFLFFFLKISPPLSNYFTADWNSFISTE